MHTVITRTEKETVDLGKKLSKKFKGGEIIALYGYLGAGKTTLIKGIARGLGIKKVITSPTFILMNVHQLPASRLGGPATLRPRPFGHKLRAEWAHGRETSYQLKYFIHIDCYRIKNEKDILNIGAQEYFGRKDSVVVIEWAERIQKILPKKIIRLKISIKNNCTRYISVAHSY